MRASVNLVPGTARRAKLTCQQSAKSEADGMRASAKSASQLSRRASWKGEEPARRAQNAKSEKAKSQREERRIPPKAGCAAIFLLG